MAAPFDAGERGTTPAQRGVSVAPQRNAPRSEDGVLDAGPMNPGLTATTHNTGASEGGVADATDSTTLPRFASDFAAKFEKLKKEYADEEAAEYADSLSDPTPKQRAAAKAIGDRARAKIVAELDGLTPYDLIGPATDLASKWITTTLAELARRQSNVSDCLTMAFADHFAAATEEQFATVAKELVSKLTSLRDGDKGLNSTSPIYSCDGAWCFGSAAGYTSNSSGSILCQFMLKLALSEYRAMPRSYSTLAMTLMHEGLHRVAYSHFNHWGSEIYHDNPKYKSLDLAEHLGEVDSFVYFARDVARCVEA